MAGNSKLFAASAAIKYNLTKEGHKMEDYFDEGEFMDDDQLEDSLEEDLEMDEPCADDAEMLRWKINRMMLNHRRTISRPKTPFWPDHLLDGLMRKSSSTGVGSGCRKNNPHNESEKSSAIIRYRK
jgi:hypothetical protein